MESQAEDENPISIKSTVTKILDLPPSCIEFSLQQPDLFVVGTYNLENRSEAASSSVAGIEEQPDAPLPQKRSGSLLLFQLNRQTLEL